MLKLIPGSQPQQLKEAAQKAEQEREAKGGDMFTWNGCGVSMQDLGDMMAGLEPFGWDVVCLQEGLKSSDPQTFQDQVGHTVVSSRGVVVELLRFWLILG